jgi:2,3-bisphosphoglycerate-dependent phosphoglycerate mutase
LAKRVLLIRHAESAAPHIFNGAESDIGLSERGLKQALTLAPIIAEFTPNRLVSSGMRRALETAKPIAKACSLPLLIEPDLHERRVGALSGTPFGAKDGVWPDTLARWINGETAYAPDGSESYEAIQQRVLPIWNRLTNGPDQETLVIVAHGVVCKILLLSVVSELDPSHWTRIGPIMNAGITELHWKNNDWAIIRLNEVPVQVAII